MPRPPIWQANWGVVPASACGGRAPSVAVFAWANVGRSSCLLQRPQRLSFRPCLASPAHVTPTLSSTMRADYAFFLAALLVPVVGTGPVDYFFKSSFMGHDFLQHWTWFTGDDPTHGCVNYVDQATALQYNLSYGEYYLRRPSVIVFIAWSRSASDRKFVLRADSENILSPSDPRGRKSVRIQSVEAYSDAIIILDLQHMPEGCGTWPAFWSVSAAGPWPKGGEIDIIEGACNQRIYGPPQKTNRRRGEPQRREYLVAPHVRELHHGPIPRHVRVRAPLISTFRVTRPRPLDAEA